MTSLPGPSFGFGARIRGAAVRLAALALGAAALTPAVDAAKEPVYALVNARIVTVSGTTLDHGTLVLDAGGNP